MVARVSRSPKLHDISDTPERPSSIFFALFKRQMNSKTRNGYPSEPIGPRLREKQLRLSIHFQRFSGPATSTKATQDFRKIETTYPATSKEMAQNGFDL
jgi:hypothetical protein